MQANTLPKALVNIAGKQPDRTALRMKDFGIWRDITWRQYLENVKFTALGLNSIGVKRGEHVAIIGENKPEWLYSAFGVMSLGATFAGVYTTNPAKDANMWLDILILSYLSARMKNR